MNLNGSSKWGVGVFVHNKNVMSAETSRQCSAKSEGAMYRTLPDDQKYLSCTSRGFLSCFAVLKAEFQRSHESHHVEVWRGSAGCLVG